MGDGLILPPSSSPPLTARSAGSVPSGKCALDPKGDWRRKPGAANEAHTDIPLQEGTGPKGRKDGSVGKVFKSPKSFKGKGSFKYTQGRLLCIISTYNLSQRVDNVPSRVSLRKAHELSDEQW